MYEGKRRKKPLLRVWLLTLAGLLGYGALIYGLLAMMWVLVDIADHTEAALSLLWACLMVNAMGLCAHALGALFRHGWLPEKAGWRGVLRRVIYWVIRASGIGLQIAAIVAAALAAWWILPRWFALPVAALHIAFAAAGLYAAKQLGAWLQNE